MTQLHVPPTDSPARAASHGWLTFAGVLFLVAASVNALWGILILRRRDAGIVLGTVLASVHGLTALMTIGAYPLWTVLVLVLDGLIIYGLLVHGADG